jgi:hypothetical protein
MRLEPVGGGLALALIVAAGCGAAPAALVTPPASVRPAASIGIGSPTLAPTSPATPEPDGSVGPTASPEPVVLTTSGTTNATVTGRGVSFSATGGGTATCASRPDGFVVGGITALDLGTVGGGTLGGGTLRAQWQLPATGTAPTTVEAFIDGADLAEGTFQPFWSGPARATSATQDESSGTLAFGPLTIEPDPAGKPGETATPGGVTWPKSLSGTIRWACAPWPLPRSSEVPPPSARP